MSWYNPFSWFKSKPEKTTEEMLIEKASEAISNGNVTLNFKNLPTLNEDVTYKSDIDGMYENMMKKNAEIRKKHAETVTKKSSEETYVPVFTPSYNPPSYDPPSFDVGGGESGGGGSSDSF
jgi:uncharacterized membrane protein YgcG